MNFVAVYQDFSLSLIDYINSKEPYDTMMEYRQLFDAPGVFDGLVNVLIQEFRKKPMRPHLADREARMEVID